MKRLADNKQVFSRIKRLSEIFDADYYENGIKTKKSNYKDYSWTRLGGEFTRTAAHIQKHFSPSSVLDVGCAKGFLVKALRDLGIEAYGVDASEYAVANAHPDIKEYVSLGLAEALSHDENSFDVVTCFDTLEHLTPRDVPRGLLKTCFPSLEGTLFCVSRPGKCPEILTLRTTLSAPASGGWSVLRNMVGWLNQAANILTAGYGGSILMTFCLW